MGKTRAARRRLQTARRRAQRAAEGIRRGAWPECDLSRVEALAAVLGSQSSMVNPGRSGGRSYSMADHINNITFMPDEGKPLVMMGVTGFIIEREPAKTAAEDAGVIPTVRIIKTRRHGLRFSRRFFGG